MKGNKQRSVLMLLAIIMLAALTMMAGCSGSDGATGATGPAGPAGPAGPTGPGATSAFGTHNILQGKVDAVITVTSVKNVSGKAKVDFQVLDSDGKPVTTVGNSNLSLKIADLVLAGTGDNTYSTDYYEMWVSESPGKAAGGTAPYNTPKTNNLVNNGDGTYSYTFVTPFGSAWPGYNNAGYAATNKKRVAIEMSSPPTGYNKAVGIMDFDGDPGAGNTATKIDSQRQFVTIEACRQCHSKYMDNAAHADSRNDIRECDFCHSALYGSAPKHATGFMANDNADLPVFIHQIHASKYTTKTFVEQPITFPQPIQKCDICHSDPSGSAPADLTELDNWKNHPTARVCSSCHTGNIMGADNKSMKHDPTFVVSGPNSAPTGTVTDATCAGCHAGANTAGDYTDIVTVHDSSPTGLLATGLDVPEYNVTVSVPTPSNGSYFVSGETFTVDVTLAVNPAFTGTATPVPAAYTDPKDPAGAYSAGNGLNVASLYLYGPRSHAVPLLGSQALSLFGTGDATGFHYAVTVPAGTASGTYMARARIADYSYNRSVPAPAGQDAYHIESFDLKAFQIGSATVQKKIDGDAAGESVCSICHGVTTMHSEDHAAPFNSDHCVACHDLSGGHADPIANRVHAVHDANTEGDLTAGRNWDEITYPSNIKRCNVCHNSGNTAYKTNLYAIPCWGCHADATGEPQAHMLSMGGVVSGFTATTLAPESCGVCHAPGQAFDISD